MKTRLRLALIAFTAVLAAPVAVAQVPPSQWTQDYIPTLTDWQAAFANAAQGLVVAFRGTAARTFAALSGDQPGPASYLSSGQTEAQLIGGQIDAEPAIQAAIAATGGVTLPCGTYLLKEGLTFTSDGQFIRGASQGCAQLLVGFATGDVISATQHSFDVVRDLNIAANVPRTTGAAIDFIGTFKGTVDNVIIQNAGGKHFSGIELQSANTTVIKDVEMTGGGTGMGLQLTGSSGGAVDTYVDRMNINGYNYGVEIDSASGIYLHHMDILASVVGGVYVAPAGTSVVNALFADTVLVDTSVNNGWVFTGSRPISEVKLSECWGAGSGTVSPGASPTVNAAGLLANDPSLDGISIQSSHFHHNGGAGIVFGAGNNVQIGGGTTTLMNAVAVPNGADGLDIGGGTNYVQVDGVISGTGGYMSDVQGLTNQQRYGVDIEPGESNDVVQLGMIITRNNKTGGLTNPNSTTIQVANTVAGN